MVIFDIIKNEKKKRYVTIRQSKYGTLELEYNVVQLKPFTYLNFLAK